MNMLNFNYELFDVFEFMIRFFFLKLSGKFSSGSSKIGKSGVGKRRQWGGSEMRLYKYSNIGWYLSFEGKLCEVIIVNLSYF